MAGGPPVLRIGAEGFLGFKKQAVFGTPEDPITADVKNWVEFTAIDLNYDAAWHAIETGAGSRATERKAGRGMSKTQGGFTTLLQPTAGAALLTRFFGLDTKVLLGDPHVITPTQPQLLTLQKIMADQALQYTDVLLDTLVLQQAGAEWTARYTVLGGVGDTEIASSTPTMPPDSLVFQWGDTTLTSSFGGIPQSDVSGITLTFNNNVRQFPGAGSYAPTKAYGGKLAASGQCTYLFDSATAATAMANYITGTEATMTTVMTIHSGAGTPDPAHKLTVAMPNSHMTASAPQQTLDELVQVQVSWFVRKAELITLTLINDDTTAGGYG